MGGGGVPGARVGPRRIGAQRRGSGPVAAHLEIGNGVEDRPIQAGQDLGDGLVLHVQEDGPGTSRLSSNRGTTTCGRSGQHGVATP